jgi:hypothetical protein
MAGPITINVSVDASKALGWRLKAAAVLVTLAEWILNSGLKVEVKR